MSNKFLKRKTLFVLVHTSDMLIPAGSDIIMEVKKTLSNAPLVYRKTLWSSVIENCLEYVRIVHDLFGTERKFGLVVVDLKEKVYIEPDSLEKQNWRHWIKTTSEIGPPQNAFSSLTPDNIPGLESIIPLLAGTHDSSTKGGGRVIVIGYKMSDNVLKWMEEIQTVLECHNGQEQEPIINFSEWNFIDIEPVTENSVQYTESPIQVLDKNNNNQYHKIYRQTTMANVNLHRCLMSLLERHHELACTLVQNIPMKEDTATNTPVNTHNAAHQQQNSAMYGVELIHCRDALLQIELAGLGKLMTMSHQPFCGFSRCVGIRWVTPRQTQDIDYYNTRSVHRVTTADVCNRASCCLSNFVLEGRSVILEIDPGVLSLSSDTLPDRPHELMLLTSHSGMLYIHALPAHPGPTSFIINSEPIKFPCITDLSYKKLANKLRVNDFCQLILASRLAPSTSVSKTNLHDEMEIYTRYWPELTSDTLIFNKPLMPKILELLMKKKLEFSDKSNCIAFLQQLIFDQSQSEKTASKKQLLENKTFKTELELLLTLYKDRSQYHNEIYNSFSVFATALSGLVDIGDLLKLQDSTTTNNNTNMCVGNENEVTSEIYSGLTKMDKLLTNSGELMKQILTKSKNSKTNSSSDQLKNTNFKLTSNSKFVPGCKRPKQSSMSLSDLVMDIYYNQPETKNRRKFDGELAAKDGVTELYLNAGTTNAANMSVNTTGVVNGIGTTLPASVLSVVADIVSSTSATVSNTPIVTNTTSTPPTVVAVVTNNSGGAVDPRR